MIAVVMAALLLDGASHPTPRRTTVYLNFEGASLIPGPYADLDQAACVTEPLLYPSYGGDLTDMVEVAEEVRRLLSPYAIRVTWRERPPAHLPYDTVIFGGRSTLFGLDPSLNGVACVVDCSNHSARDTAFVFSEGPIEPDQLGRLAVHELAHTWGLEHVDGAEHLMNRFFSDERGTAIGQTCAPLDVEEAFCPQQHARNCPPGTQNTHSELVDLFGTNTIDDTPPRVHITSPEPDQIFAPGDVVSIDVRVTDDDDGFGWKFSVPELEWEYIAHERETRVDLVVPEGTFNVVVDAIDHDRNVGRDAITITVLEQPGGSNRPTTGCTARGGHPPRPSLAWWSLLPGLFRRQRRPWRR